jgi:hypothetical protein
LIIPESPGKVNPWQGDKSGQKEDPIVRTLRTLKTWFRAQIALIKNGFREPDFFLKNSLTIALIRGMMPAGEASMNPLETHLKVKKLYEIRSSGEAVKETFYYGPLTNL